MSGANRKQNPGPIGGPLLLDGWALWLLPLFRLIERAIRSSPGLFRLFTRRYPGRLAEWLSPYAAYACAHRTARTVPAYQDFLRSPDWHPTGSRVRDRFESLPLLTKENYVRRYSIGDRCVGGRIPMDGSAVDESSGSSGMPTNWVRGKAEREEVYRLARAAHLVLFGTQDLFTINAYSMGAWATGLMVANGFDDAGIIKTIGPDIDKILDTLTLFGPSFTYVIYGYPPFLKLLLEAGQERDFPWRQYTLYGMTGGEGMSEGLRDYLETVFARAYSVYGASDLEVGVGFETPFTVAIRKLAHKRPDLRAALFGDQTGVLPIPMLFHYDPLSHYIEAPYGTLVVTTVSPQLAPKPRYDIRDQGGVISWAELTGRLRSLNIDYRSLVKPGDLVLEMPFLYIFGRVDHTVSCMGVNVYPEDVQQAIFGDQQLASAIRSFWLGAEDDQDGNPRVAYHLELRPGVEADVALAEHCTSVLTQELSRLNRDFKVGLQESPLMAPVVQLHPADTAAADAAGVKLRYIR